MRIEEFEAIYYLVLALVFFVTFFANFPIQNQQSDIKDVVYNL
jgi:hypothetical protein